MVDGSAGSTVGKQRRYCGACGAVFNVDIAGGQVVYCPRCGVAWFVAPEPNTVPSLATLLQRIEGWHASGLLDDASHERLRREYAARLDALTSPTTDPVAGTAARPPFDVGQWASERQADILLYLGAFLLVSAAILFMGYQGKAIPPAGRVLALSFYTASFLAAGLLLPRWERVREAGPVFLAVGALMAPLNFVLTYTELFSGKPASGELIWLLGSIACTALYGALLVRGFGSLYRIPAVIALLSTWEAAFATSDLDGAWWPAWNVLGVIVVAAVAARLHSLTNGIASLLFVAMGLMWPAAHLVAAGEIRSASSAQVQLPITYALLTVTFVVIGYVRRWRVLLPCAAITAMAAVIATGWVLGVDRVWAPYPFVALAAITLIARRWWAPHYRDLVYWGWYFAGGCVLAASGVAVAEDAAAHAVATNVVGAALLAAIAALDMGRADGETEQLRRQPSAERIGFGWTAFALLLVSTAYAQRLLEVPHPDNAWAYLAIATAVAIVLAVVNRAHAWTNVALLPLFAAAVITGFFATFPLDFPGHAAVLLALGGTELAFCAAWTRRWPLATLAGIATGSSMWFGTLAVAPNDVLSDGTWLWSLAVAYSLVGTVLLVCLARWRKYSAATDAEILDGMSLVLLSWGFIVAALATALIAIGAEPHARREHVVDLTAYRVLTGVVLAAAAQIAFEGARLKSLAATVAATAVGVLAGLMAIGMTEPENVQAYTVPVAVYLFAAGLIGGRMPSIAATRAHEVVLVAAMLILALPQAQQGLEPAGAVWGLVLLLEAATLLAVGILLYQRWLAAGGVIVASGVGVRWLAQSGDTIPYWVTLGVSGLLLLAVGVLLLFQRERWDRARRAILAWWRGPLAVESDAETSAVP